MNWYLGVLKNYVAFGGRARRTEYWYFTLFNMIAMILLTAIDAVIGAPGIFSGIYSLAVCIPSIGVAVRRLHDTGRSGWWSLIALVPLIGAIVLIFFAVQDSDPGENQYGQNPKGVMV